MKLRYALNFVAITNVVSWFTYNLNLVRTNHLTLNEAHIQYLILGGFPVIFSEVLNIFHIQ